MSHHPNTDAHDELSSPGDINVSSRVEVSSDVVEEPLEEDSEVKVLEAESLAKDGFTSTVPFEHDAQADCLVICCSDHRFRQQNIEFLRACGYKYPHVISFPSGVAIAHSMVASVGFLSKAVEHLIAKAVELTEVREVVCIAHEDCGGYKAGRVQLIGKLSRRFTGKSIQEVQEEHLAQAASSIARLLPEVEVRTFFSSISEESEGERVHYREVDEQAVGRSRRRRRRSA